MILMGMQETAKQIVKLSLDEGFDEAIASVFDSASTYTKITNSKVDSIIEKHNDAGWLYLVSKKRILLINIEDLEEQSVRAKIKAAKKAISYIKPKDDYFGIAEGPFKYGFSTDADAAIKHVSNDSLSDIAYAAINEAVNNGAVNTAGMLHTYYTRSAMASSRNVAAESQSSNARLSLRSFTDDASFQDVHLSQQLAGLSPMKLGQDTSEMAKSMKETGRIKSGKYDIIFLPSPGGTLVAQVNDFVVMSEIEQGSMFTDKLGEKVASKNVTIYDSGDTREMVGVSPYDAEGYPTQTTPVIEDGVLKNYLHNYTTALKYKTKSTGNAGLINPEPNAMIFRYRKTVKDIDALVAKVDKGVIVTNAWYTRYSNYLTGDFSTMPRDLAIYVENGERKFSIRQGSVKSMIGIRVTDNMIKMLNNIECATKDTVQTTSWDANGTPCIAPSMLVRDSEITAV